MDSSGQIHGAPAWFFVVVVLAWSGISILVSVISGWYRLAARFHSSSAIAGERFSFVSMSFGTGLFPMTYRNCLFLKIGRSGMALSILLPFRIFHPPLLIPWTDVTAVRPERRWLISGAEVYVRDFNKRLFFYGRAGKRIIAAFGMYGGGNQPA